MSGCNVNPIGPVVGYNCSDHPINTAAHIFGAIPTPLAPIVGIIRIATAIFKLLKHENHNRECNTGSAILYKHIGRGVVEFLCFGWVFAIVDIFILARKGCGAEAI
jgi:hypothetical protein